jgi:hypothetical protein
MTGVYRHRHANLRRDGGEALLGRALEHAPVSQEEIYFGNDGASLPELAARFGESDGAQVYFELESIRYLWLDRANNAVFEERERRDSDPRRPA